MSPTSYQTALPRDNKNDPYGIRTHVTAVKGQCLKPLDQRVNIQIVIRVKDSTENGRFELPRRFRGLHP